MKIKINNNFYDFFDDVVISKSLDKVASTFVFKSRFNPDNKLHQELFKPLSFNKVEIYDDNDKLLFTGFSINNTFTSKSVRELQSISGYSLPGILEDVTIPTDKYPLEKNNLSLNNIIKQLVGIFGIKHVIDPEVSRDINLIYETTVAQPSESIKSYISKLASQRNIIMSHNTKGELYFFRLNINSRARYFFNETNSLSMSLSVNGQGLHSNISVIRQPSFDNNDLTPEDKVSNSLVGKYKPYVKVLSSGTDTDTKKAANNILAGELKNISLTIEFDKYIELDLGDIVEVQNKEVYLYNRSRMVVSLITHSVSNESNKTTIGLVIPESFTGENPKNIFSI